jgi:C_GCAxxG_C_C family probable redox protein
MSEKAEAAVSCFGEGFNCAQAILATYGVAFGLSRETALKTAAGFGAGMGRRGEVCGAVTGALMVLGLRYGYTEVTDKGAKGRIYDLAQDLTGRFSAAHGTLLCRELLGCDLSTAEGVALARREGYFTGRCPRFVRTAAEILDAFL